MFGDESLTLERVKKYLERLAEDESTMSVVASMLPTLVRPFLKYPAYSKYFELWESHGFHLTPNHFYEPIPDTRTLSDKLWEGESAMTGVDMNDAVQVDLLENCFPSFREEYDALPSKATGDEREFHFDNDVFGGTDALVLYCMVRHFKPRLIVEVGSGFSTRLAALAARRNGATRIVSIEPFPDEVLRRGIPGVEEVIVAPVQEVPLDRFRELQSGDILFIDTSHVVKIGGDVNFLFLEVLPALARGVIVHIHDVFLPNEYRREWVLDQKRFWTEQYMLHAFLLFNSEFEVLFGNTYMATKYPDIMKRVFSRSPWWGGGSFWIRRKLESHA